MLQKTPPESPQTLLFFFVPGPGSPSGYQCGSVADLNTDGYSLCWFGSSPAPHGKMVHCSEMTGWEFFARLKDLQMRKAQFEAPHPEVIGDPDEDSRETDLP